MLKLKLQYPGPPEIKSWLLGKDPEAGKDWGQEKGAAEDEMVGWHHWLSGHESEKTLGDSKGQGSLACCKNCQNIWTRLSDQTTTKFSNYRHNKMPDDSSDLSVTLNILKMKEKPCIEKYWINRCVAPAKPELHIQWPILFLSIMPHSVWDSPTRDWTCAHSSRSTESLNC